VSYEELITELLPYVVPVVTTVVGAYVGYRLGLKAKREDILNSEHVAAFKRVMIKLASIQRACDAYAAEYEASEFTPRFDDLSSEDQKSPLVHWQEFETIVDEVSCFLPESSVEVLSGLSGNLSSLASALLVAADNPNLARSLLSPRPAYVACSEAVSRARKALRSQLSLPNAG